MIDIHFNRVFNCKFLILVILLLLSLPIVAQEQDNDNEKLNTFTVDADFLTRGELRYGGLPDDENDNDNKAHFIIERTRLGLDFERTFLKAHVTAQHSAVWGQAGKGSFNLYEAWVQLTSRKGLFAKIGRQVISYDDERIIGPDDWTVAASSHDLLKVGYEGGAYKVHAMFAYNQNGESVNGGTRYIDGDKPYKTMEVLWYHYDHPKVPLGASLLFMNLGMQSLRDDNPDKTFQQQLAGTYVSYTPQNWSAEGSFYYQFGKNEFNANISAWMASAKGTYTPSQHWSLKGGYDYLSGDPYFVVTSGGDMGLIQHKTFKAFSPVYGSHHKFYGAMYFFYVSTYYNGFSPGLENIYGGATYKPFDKLSFEATYHYFRTATKLDNLSKALGHELELSITYKPIKEVELSAGYSYMHGGETMEKLKRVDNEHNLHWAWINLKVCPRFFQIKW